ncbi:PREDICTED: uncharacterized protein LOC107063771 [Polistes dominula]|uniref:acylglycerol lipase n=1 Tax=Polistes dominula TaxID=743375 RepID=A0ABM1HTQ6_POLDO|nr:PREDICTED: uncharacterized protein LOC107063771 [Polistes dominula]
MSTKEESIEPKWYMKFFEFWKNRNRIGPAKVELTDCDFFIVGPRRTLRVLKPSLKGEWYYENTNDNRSETINDNFFARWSKRPHSSNNCRCSFRQSSRLSTNDEEIISTELNRIRNSLHEGLEKSAKDIEELEQRVSANLQKLQIPDVKHDNNNERKTKDEIESDPSRSLPLTPSTNEEIKDKNKIVKDLERYINVLLEEILDDTVNYVTNLNENVTNVKFNADEENRLRIVRQDELTSKNNPKKKEIFNEINFSFHTDNQNIRQENENTTVETTGCGGYLNHAFLGSAHDPDCSDYYILNSNEVILEQLDCIDSGINSVETIEFQPDQEPSLEQSLLRIIDEKLGRTPLKTSWEDLRTNNDEKRNESSQKINENNEENKLSKLNDVVVMNENDTKDEEIVMDIKQLESSIDDPKFENVRLELENENVETPDKKDKTMGTKFCARFRMNIERRSKRNDDKKIETINIRKETTTPLEMEDYRKNWPNLDESTILSNCEQNPHDFVVFRRNCKPTLVFLHGFGSSADIFEHQLEYFSAMGYPCIAPDLLGHGMSSAPDRSKDYLFNKLLKDLETVLHYYAFKPGQKCILIAHNYGCSFATALACKYDSNIHQLVLISGGGPTPLAPPTKEGAGRCFLRAILSPLLMCGLHRDILYSARGRQHPYCGPEPIEQWPSHMKYVLNGMAWPEGDYVFHRRIFTPSLLIHGLKDNKVSLVQECQMERTMVKAFLEAIPSAGHTPMTDCPDQLNHMIHCFIDLWKNKNW